MTVEIITDRKDGPVTVPPLNETVTEKLAIKVAIGLTIEKFAGKIFKNPETQRISDVAAHQ